MLSYSPTSSKFILAKPKYLANAQRPRGFPQTDQSEHTLLRSDLKIKF
jgi:hypothetical protein